MIGPFSRHSELLVEDTASHLKLGIPHPLRMVGNVLMVCALISIVGVIASDLGMTAVAVAMLFGGLGIWLARSYRSVTFHIPRREVLFATHYPLLEKRKTVVPFGRISAIYLDYQEQAIPRVMASGDPTVEWIKRKWTIFLVLANGKTVTVADRTTEHLAQQDSVVSSQLAYWEHLAARICMATGRLLIRTPSVPGSPHTFVEIIDQIIQRRLAHSQLDYRSVHLHCHTDGSLEIEVDGKAYRQLEDVSDGAVRELIQAAVEEWQCMSGRKAEPPQAAANSR